MRDLLLTIFVIILLSSSNLFAQYTTNIFLNYTPQWQHNVYDSTAIPEMEPKYPNGIEYENSFVEDNFLYSVFKYYYGYNPNGGRIEKLNLNTGKANFISQYDLRNIYINEKPNRIFINSTGELEVIGFRGLNRKKGNDSHDIYYKLVHRHYDKNSGELIKKVHEKNGDSLALLMSAFYNGTHNLFAKNRNAYNRFITINGSFKKEIMNTILDTFGIPIDTFKITCDHNYKVQEVKPFYYLSKDTIVTTMIIDNGLSQLDDLYDHQFYIIITDEEFTKVDSFNITEIAQLKNRFTVKNVFTDNNYIVLFIENEPAITNWDYFYLFFDYDGNLLSRVDMKRLYFHDTKITRLSVDEFLIVGPHKSHIKDIYDLSFYKYKIGKELKLLRQIDMLEKKTKLVVRNIDILENKDILVVGNVASPHFVLQEHLEIKYPVVIRFPKKDIWDYVGTDNISIDSKNALSVYPNPASVEATISVYSEGYEYGKIRVFDINGEMIRSMDIDSDATLSLDVEELTPGVYVVEYVSYLSGGRDVRKLVVVE